MGGYDLGCLPWMAPGFYPVKERLIDGADTDPEAPFLVDIGGNVGHDLARFHKFYPESPGKLKIPWLTANMAPETRGVTKLWLLP
jgi:hypothetical protein